MEKENNIVKTNEKIEVIDNVEDIKHKIYTIRGKQVMIDSDVAELYQCETKYINRVVKRNINRFPEEFCFQLTENEFDCLRFQFVTLNKKGRGQHRKYLPYAFTEHGITMLASLLNSQTAVNISIKIVNTFIEMRQYISSSGQVIQRLTTLEYQQLQNEKNFDKVFNLLQQKDTIKQRIFFEGQIWDAYNLIMTIIKKAEKKILIIDNYIDDTILDMLSKKNKNVEVVILTSNNSNISNLDIQKFNKEYPTLKLAKTNKFHDRFIVIDNKKLYHSGASLKDLGKKCFAITKMEDIEYIEKLKRAASGN